ncbi:TspO/MBR family-domain-containing protein [Melampsora americana]|nr:TspO/MBR family-domain-containing protein [Melampsora americana]
MTSSAHLNSILPNLPINLLRVSLNPIYSTVLPVLLGTTTGLITRTSVKTWYPKLRKPPFEPPRWAFPVAWTYLYSSMGYASHLLTKTYLNSFNSSHSIDFLNTSNLSLKFYFLQLCFNLIWTPIFFGQRQIGLALLNISILDLNVFYLTYLSKKVNQKAFYLLLPYCAWLSYATYLNAGVWYLNGGQSKLNKLYQFIITKFNKKKLN